MARFNPQGTIGGRRHWATGGERRCAHRHPDAAASARCAFTLIEMLVVLGIIGVLAGLVLTGLRAARIHARNSAIEHDLQNLSLVIEQYLNHYGKYPASAEGPGADSNEMLLIALSGRDAEDGEVFFTEALRNEIKIKDTDNDGDGEMMDRWGFPYHYQHHRWYDDEPRRTSFRLWSVGQDGESLTADDLVSWDRDQYPPQSLR